MRRLLLSIILICLLTVPASAHSGKTDSSGGHYDHDTGDYHYHHGYSAHDHYDMDGDGDLDCPYDFDDQTDRSSGTASSTYSPSSTTESDYRRGYENGKADGYDDGFNDGKTFGQTAAEKRGYDKGYADGYSSGYSKARLLGFAGIAAVSTLAFLLLRHKRKQIDELQREHARELREADRDLRAVESERDELQAQQEAVRDDCRAQINQALTTCQRRIKETEDRCNVRIDQIEGAARLKIQNYFVDCFDPLRKSTMQFPKDVDLHRWGVSRGACTPERPFGDLTVYRTPSGKCFHTMRGCCGATEPVCIYEERLRYVTGCSKCTDYRTSYQEAPDWYRKYKLLLGGAFAPRPNAPSQPRSDTEPIIKLGRDQQFRIEMGPAVAARDEDCLTRESAPYERLNDRPEQWGKPIAASSQFNPKKPLTISKRVLNDHALRWGVDIYTALQMYNNDRKRIGLSPLVLDEEK